MFDHQTGTTTVPNSSTTNLKEGNTDYSLFSAKNPQGTTKGGRVWGLAVYRDRLYYGVWRQDSGDYNGRPKNEVWSLELQSNGTPTGAAAQLEITLPFLYETNPTIQPELNGKYYSNPVSSISFSPAGDMLLAERSMNGDKNNAGGVYAAHESRVLEYTWFPPITSNTSGWTLQSPNKFGVGSPHLFSTAWGSRPSSAGGADYDIFGGRVWASGDALHYRGTFPLAPDPQTPKNTDYIYGIQGLSMTSGGTIHNSLLINTSNDPDVVNKNETGDVEIPCPVCR